MAHETHDYLPPGKTHDCETKVRLTEPDDNLLRALAARAGIPPAVLARSMIKRGLDLAANHGATLPVPAQNGRGGESRNG